MPPSMIHRLLACCFAGSSKNGYSNGGDQILFREEAARSQAVDTRGRASMERRAAQSHTERHFASQPLPQHAAPVQEDAPIPVRMPSGNLNSSVIPMLGLPKEPSFTSQDKNNKGSDSPSETQPRVYSPDFTFSSQTPEKAEALPRGRRGSHPEAEPNGSHAEAASEPDHRSGYRQLYQENNSLEIWGGGNEGGPAFRRCNGDGDHADAKAAATQRVPGGEGCVEAESASGELARGSVVEQDNERLKGGLATPFPTAEQTLAAARHFAMCWAPEPGNTAGNKI